jgi:hypothetical protein
MENSCNKNFLLKFFYLYYWYAYLSINYYTDNIIMINTCQV